MNESSEELLRLALAAFSEQRLDDAEALLRRALTAQTTPAAHYYLGGVLEAQGKQDEALQHFDAALAGDPRNPPTLHARARIRL